MNKKEEPNKLSYAKNLPAPSGLRVTSISEDLMVLSHELPGISKENLKGLSETEQEICQLVFAGLSDHDIALVRSRAVRTITTQLRTLYQKVGVNSRTELIAWLYDES